MRKLVKKLFGGIALTGSTLFYNPSFSQLQTIKDSHGQTWEYWEDGRLTTTATYNGEKAVWGGKEYKHDIIWHDLRNKLSYIEAPKEDTKTEQF